MGQALIDQHFGAEVNKHQVMFRDDETIYRLLEDDQSIALNAGPTSQCEPRPGRNNFVSYLMMTSNDCLAILLL